MWLVRDQLFCDAESVSMKNVYYKMISLPVEVMQKELVKLASATKT